MGHIFRTALSNWFIAILVIALMIPTGLWAGMWTLRALLTLFYAIGGNPPAGFEGVF